MTESQWGALLNLESNRDKYKAAGGPVWLDIEGKCRLIKEWTSTDVDDDILEKMICIVSANFIDQSVSFAGQLAPI